MSHSFKEGDVVYVNLEEHEFLSEKATKLIVEKESGVVLKTNCAYENDSGEEFDDGIMVKMKISNTKGIYPPSCVSNFVSSPISDSSKRRSTRGSLVSPSPDKEQCHDSSSKVEEKKQPKKRSRKEEEHEKPTKKSKYFPSGDDGHSSNENSLKFRVQKSPNSAAKCKHCKAAIKKGALRVQPFDSKRGWYLPNCLSSEFPGMSFSSAETADFEGHDDLSEEDQKILTDELNGVTAVVSSNSDNNNDGDDEEEEKEEEDDPPLSALKAKKKPAKKPAKKTTSKKGKKSNNNNNNAPAARSNIIAAPESDSDDDKDMPYRVEYAATGRATCKGCDERITKGVMRIANKPLFRGKPGFVVYRHLHCTVFSENIEQISDVGGWRRLNDEDREVLKARVEESKELVQKENEELRPDELVQATFQGETRGPPPGLTATLLPFQVEGHSWMYHQEVAIPELRGGIMADEMGMGKTLQTIATILDNRPKLQHATPGAKHPPSAPDIDARKTEEALWKDAQTSWEHEMEMCNVPKRILVNSKKKGAAPLGVRAGTLVICPVIALFQWKTEIEKFTDGKTLTVGIYHGPKRASENPRELLCKYDVVLTTYQVIESDFRKMVSPNKVKCPNCGGSYKIDKLRVHLKYFCGESAQRTEAQSRQRRTADRHEGNQQRPRGSGGGGGGKKKKMFSKKAHDLQTVKRKGSSNVRVKRSAAYDSDSELSVPDDLEISAARPSRSAAKNAKKRLSASAKQTIDSGESSDDDSDAFQTGTSSSSESEDEESVTPVKTTKRKVIATPKESYDSSFESEDDGAIARARSKQAAAMRRAKASGKGRKRKLDDKVKGKAKKGKVGKKPRGKMTKGKKKKFDDSSDSSSSDEDTSDEEVNDDPLAGIDIDKLMEEAIAGAKPSVLHTMSWWRVVLDEAHFIKSRSSQTAAASFSLTSIHRWCLSGTPLQNRVGELYSLIRFLRIDPMAHYFCRKEGCDCKSIHYRMMNGRCQDCGCSSIQHFSYFNKHVLNPIQRAGYQGDGRRAMMKLKNEVLDQCLIRRTKESRAEDMNLPPRVVNIKTIRLHPIEEDFYNGLYTETKNSFNDYIHEGTLLNNYAHIFDLLTKMRQAVDHPYLIVHSKKYAERNLQSRAPAIANGSVNCELCNEPPTSRVVSSCCGAGFCRECVVDFMSASLDDNNTNHDSSNCPSCREPFTIDLNQENADIEDDGTLTISPSKTTTGSPFDLMPSLKEMTHVSSGSILRRINLAEFATSTKIEALVQELVEMRQSRPGSKALVFSQFVNMLDLIRWRLHSDPCLADLGLGVRIIHGGMNVHARDQALKDFKGDNSVRVLLMSLKAGGVALNLTVANEAYLMDPWWNPAAEMQAIDRTHRLGQHRAIRAVRFIAEGTVEERVLQLQEKKRLVFDGTVGRDAASLKMLTVDDMKALFT